MKFFIDDLQADEFRMRLFRNPSFALCFKRNITLKFLANYKRRDSGVYAVHGSTGSGKSSLVIALASMKQPDFSASQIAFTNDELKKVVYSSKPGDVFMRDETVRDFGEGSGQMMATIQDLTETLRQRRNSFFLLSPVVKGQPFVHYYLELLQANVPLDAGSMKEYYDSGGKLLWFRVGVQDVNFNYLGYIKVPSVVNSQTWVDYQAKKNKFLQDMATGERKSGVDYEAEAERLLKLIDLSVYSKKGERKVFIKQNTNFTSDQVMSVYVTMERLIEQRGLIPKADRHKKPKWDSKRGVMYYE